MDDSSGGGPTGGDATANMTIENFRTYCLQARNEARIGSTVDYYTDPEGKPLLIYFDGDVFWRLEAGPTLYIQPLQSPKNRRIDGIEALFAFEEAADIKTSDELGLDLLLLVPA